MNNKVLILFLDGARDNGLKLRALDHISKYFWLKVLEEISSNVPYLLTVEGDPLTYEDAMASYISTFGKRVLMMRCNPSWEITLMC